MALDKAKIVDELSNATVIEIADLVKELEPSGASPPPRRCRGRRRSGRRRRRSRRQGYVRRDPCVGAPGQENRRHQSRPRSEGRFGAGGSQGMVEGAPKPILEGANKADSDAAKKKLEDAGGKVEVK